MGPEHSYLKETGRAEYCAITDKEALKAFQLLSRMEGIIPALESAHVIAQAVKMKKDFKKSDIVIANLSGRGDKDLNEAAKYIGKNF